MHKIKVVTFALDCRNLLGEGMAAHLCLRAIILFSTLQVNLEYTWHMDMEVKKLGVGHRGPHSCQSTTNRETTLLITFR